jgi:hypothetical protein
MKKQEQPAGTIKSNIASLSKEILAKEKKTIFLIKKEMKFEKKLTALLAKMIKLEETKILGTKKTTSEKELRLLQRIENLQKKQQEYQKKKDAARHINEKQRNIKKEIELLNSKLKKETGELYGIKKMAATANSSKEKKLLSIAGKKTVKNKKKKTVGLAGGTNETKKQWAKAKKIAEVTKELKKALEKEETKTPEKKQEPLEETILENPEKKEETEEPQEENQEPQEETGESSQKETFDWEKRQKELIGETFSENPEEKEEKEKIEEQQEENQEPLEEKTSETLEKMELSEESEEEPFFKEEETTNISEETLASTPEKNTKEYNDKDISLQYPNWKESKEKSADSLLAVAQPPFRFELSKTEIFNQTIQKFVSSKTEKIQSKPGSKILIQKETSNNIFIEYSEETMGEKFLSKALFILHKNNAYSIIFTAPSDQFQKIDDLFLKTIFSVQTY